MIKKQNNLLYYGVYSLYPHRGEEHFANSFTKSAPPLGVNSLKGQGWSANVSVKDRVREVLVFANHTVSVASTQLGINHRQHTRVTGSCSNKTPFTKRGTV